MEPHVGVGARAIILLLEPEAELSPRAAQGALLPVLADVRGDVGALPAVGGRGAEDAARWSAPDRE